MQVKDLTGGMIHYTNAAAGHEHCLNSFRMSFDADNVSAYTSDKLTFVKHGIRQQS
jgi:hypothetical protein